MAEAGEVLHEAGFRAVEVAWTADEVEFDRECPKVESGHYSTVYMALLTKTFGTSRGGLPCRGGALHPGSMGPEHEWRLRRS